MRENSLRALIILSIMIGAAGLGFGLYSMQQVQPETIKGEHGSDGDDGIDGKDGQDAPGGITLGILNPGDEEIISGKVSIKAIISGSEAYIVSILKNGTEIGTALPMTWDTTKDLDGYWNITVIVIDIASNNRISDQVLVVVNNVDVKFEYLCSSITEINDALQAIGTGYGIIIITDFILINQPIDVNGQGSYVFRGTGKRINCIEDITLFNISNAISCTIQDLIIQIGVALSENRPIININETNNNPVYVRNVQIIGSYAKGLGVNIQSENVWISNCYFNGLYSCIYQPSEVDKAHISDNTFVDCYHYGMNIRGNYNYISGNNIRIFSGYGIYLAGNNSIIENNILTIRGIFLVASKNNIISGNIISGAVFGVYMTDSSYNMISGNIFSDVNNFGIYLDSSDYNSILDNAFSKIDEWSIWLENSDCNVISANTISGFNHSTGGYIGGIMIYSDSDYNTISGNGCFNHTNYYATSIGLGIFITDSSCNDNTVVGNTCLGNDDNYEDDGTDTYEYGNNFDLGP